MKYQQRLERIEQAIGPSKTCMLWRRPGETIDAAIERTAKEGGTTPAALKAGGKLIVIGWGSGPQ